MPSWKGEGLGDRELGSTAVVPALMMRMWSIQSCTLPPLSPAVGEEGSRHHSGRNAISGCDAPLKAYDLFTGWGWPVGTDGLFSSLSNAAYRLSCVRFMPIDSHQAARTLHEILSNLVGLFDVMSSTLGILVCEQHCQL